MLDDEKFKDVYNMLMDTSNRAIEEYENEDENIHLVVAGVLTTMGLSMYKSVMSEKDFDKMMKLMIHMKEEIKSYKEIADEAVDSELLH